MRSPSCRQAPAAATVLLTLLLAWMPAAATQPTDTSQSTQLFIPTALNKADPTTVVTPPGEPPTIVAVAAGAHHTCAVTDQGGVKCWGSNFDGQLGDGTAAPPTRNTMRAQPVDVIGLTSGVQAVAAGSYHTCALTTAGGIKCWGANGTGQLGDGTQTARFVPVDVVGLSSGVKAVTAGHSFTCALTTAGSAKCWGQNVRGALGNGVANEIGYPLDSAVPTDVVGLATGVQAISAGYNHVCALTTGGGVKCWGDSEFGQVGDGTTGDDRLCSQFVSFCRPTPADVVGLASGVRAIAAGDSFTCAVTTAGGVKCWGLAHHGALGDGTEGEPHCYLSRCRLTPVAVVGLQTGVRAIAAGQWLHSCALMEDGSVKCWGRNLYGQLGDGTAIDRWTPVAVVGLAGAVSAIEAGQEHVCAALADGGMQCWGEPASGKLGIGIVSTPMCGEPPSTYQCQLTPVDVVWQ